MTVMYRSQDFMDSLHMENVFGSLNDQRTQGVFCDVTIVVEDIKFKAHRNVLAASSPYFKKHFLASSICVPGHIVELNDLKADVFTEILNFIYSSKLVVKQRDSLLDLAAAGKKLGIAFLENLKNDSHISKSLASASCSGNSDPQVSSVPFAVHSYPERLKVENGDKAGDDPAVTNCPRITNAFSIVETGNGNDVFPELDLRANIKRTPLAQGKKPTIVCLGGIDACSNANSINALAEHTYALSCVNAFFCRELLPVHPNPLSSEASKEIKQPSPPTLIIQAKKVAYTTPKKAFLKKYACLSDAQMHSSLLSSEINNCHTITPAFNPCKVMDFQLPGEMESSPSPSIPADATGTALVDDRVLPNNHSLLSQRSQGPYKCKNCSKPFTNDKRLARHEQICLRPVHLLAQSGDPYRFGGNCTGNSIIENMHSSQIPSLPTNEMSSASTEDKSGQDADHFVKIVNEQIFYICIVCQRHYVTLSSLRRHANVHSWRKTYPCHYCNQVFALAEYRTKHEIWHTGDRRYQCIFCLETFMTYYILKNHQKSFHGIDPRLGVKKKTANGRLKSSVYSYKLYRLLPMKGKRTSIKDLSNGASEIPELCLQSFETVSNSCFSQTPLNSELSAFFQDPCDALSSTDMSVDTTPCKESSIAHDSSVSWELQCSSGQALISETQVPPFEKESNSCCEEQINSANRCQNVNIISSANSPSSLTIHSSTASSVIMHGNEVASFATRESETFNGALSKDIKEEKNDELDNLEKIKSEVIEVSPKEQEKMASSATLLKKANNIDQEDGKTVTYIAKPALPRAFVNSGVEPLCKITVRIGSEAMVRRHIPGSNLFSERVQTGQNQKREEQEYKAENRERSSGRLRRLSQSIRMNEICDDESDQDSKDKSWLPYCNNKPKKRSKHLKKIHKSKKHDKKDPICESENVFNTVNVLGQNPTEDISKENIKEEKLAINEEKIDTPSIICDSDVCSKEGAANAEQWHPASSASFCELCQKEFRNPSALKVHMRCHTGEKPYSCKTCGKCFSFLGNLHKHEQIHLGIKIYICQHCSKTFTLSETLKKHEMIHTREKLHKCQFCPKSFRSMFAKKNHEQRHELKKGLKGFVCHQCSRVCKTADALSIHLKMHYLKKLQRWAGKAGRTEQCRKLRKYITHRPLKGVNELRWSNNSSGHSYSDLATKTNNRQDELISDKGAEDSSAIHSQMYEQPKKEEAVLLSTDFLDGDSLKQSPKHKSWDCRPSCQRNLAESGALNCQITSTDKYEDHQ